MSSAQGNTARRAFMSIIAACAWFALVLQLLLTIRDTHVAGTSVATAVFNYFSFFTILTNLLVAYGLTVSLGSPQSRQGRFFSRPAAIAATAIYIVLVGATYALLLRRLFHPQGWDKLANFLLHDFDPIAFAVYWLIFAPKRGLRLRHAFLWLIYPAVFAVYTFLRGRITGWYPYPFMDAGAIGLRRALANAAIIGAIVLAAGLLLVAVCRRFSGDRAAAGA